MATHRKRVPLSQVLPNPRSVRRDEEDLLQKCGDEIELPQIRPLKVRRVAEDRFEVIDGHRRLAAAKAAGLVEVEVEIVGEGD